MCDIIDSMLDHATLLLNYATLLFNYVMLLSNAYYLTIVSTLLVHLIFILASCYILKKSYNDSMTNKEGWLAFACIIYIISYCVIYEMSFDLYSSLLFDDVYDIFRCKLTTIPLIKCDDYDKQLNLMCAFYTFLIITFYTFKKLWCISVVCTYYQIKFRLTNIKFEPYNKNNHCMVCKDNYDMTLECWHDHCICNMCFNTWYIDGKREFTCLYCSSKFDILKCKFTDHDAMNRTLELIS